MLSAIPSVGRFRFGFCLVIVLATLSVFRVTAAVHIILDTDFETDVDDVAALGLLHAYAARGEVEILGICVAGLYPELAEAIHCVNTYFGRPDIPIGVRRSDGVMRESSYTRMLIERFPAPFDASLASEAVTLYRRLLAREKSDSVVILSVGYLTNLADLLRSPGDAVSPLNGRKLVASKVSRYVCMGGSYPRQVKTGQWGNFLPDPTAVRHVNRQWPTPIIFSGGSPFSRSVPAGRAFVTEFPEGNLLRLAYETFFRVVSWASPPDHHCADLIAVQLAVKGAEPFFVETMKGHSHVFKDGTMEWRRRPDRPNRSYVADLAAGIDGREVGEYFERLILEACPDVPRDASAAR